MSTLVERLRAASDYVAYLPAEAPDPTVSAEPWSNAITVKWHLSTTDGVTDQRATAVAIRRALGGKWDKGGSGDTMWLEYSTEWRGVPVNLTIFVDRSQVCERVVTTESVLIPAMPAEPERTEVVETIEWRCDPILTGDESVEAVAS